MNPPLHPDVTVVAKAAIRENTCDPRDHGWVRVDLVYGKSDPHAAWFLCYKNAHDTAAWAVARDVVAAGCASPAGSGDVRVRPEGADLVVTFESPEGRFVFTLSRTVVVKFLKATFRAVRQGRETVDVDEAIARMRPTGWVL